MVALITRDYEDSDLGGFEGDQGCTRVLVITGQKRGIQKFTQNHHDLLGYFKGRLLIRNHMNNYPFLGYPFVDQD